MHFQFGGGGGGFRHGGMGGGMGGQRGRQEGACAEGLHAAECRQIVWLGVPVQAVPVPAAAALLSGDARQSLRVLHAVPPSRAVESASDDDEWETDSDEYERQQERMFM